MLDRYMLKEVVIKRKTNELDVNIIALIKNTFNLFKEISPKKIYYSFVRNILVATDTIKNG